MSEWAKACLFWLGFLGLLALALAIATFRLYLDFLVLTRLR